MDLKPYLTGEKSGRPHDALYCRTGSRWAIRDGDWKLVCHEGKKGLFDLANDVGENTNLATAQPQRVETLAAKFHAWESQLAAPAWPNPATMKPVTTP